MGRPRETFARSSWLRAAICGLWVARSIASCRAMSAACWPCGVPVARYAAASLRSSAPSAAVWRSAAVRATTSS